MSNELYNDEKIEALAQKSVFLQNYVKSDSIMINGEWLYFYLCDPCTTTEELSAEAEEIQAEMLELGYDGALIGHPFDESLLCYIRFRVK